MLVLTAVGNPEGGRFVRPVLFEFAMLDKKRALLFIGREDLAEPVVLELALDRAALRESLGHSGAHRWPDNAEFGVWQELLGALLEPVAEWSQPGDVVWFVPHAELHAVPLHALKLPGGSLIDRNPVCYTPSASLMSHCRDRRSERRSSVLVAADSRSDRRLRYAALEAREVAAAFDHAIVHLGDEATLTTIDEDLSSKQPAIDVLHLACHAEFDDMDAMESAIALAGQERLTAHRLARFRTEVSLISLSACGSGRTRLVPGDELLGLSRAAFAAGAAALVVSLWSVEELSTALLMREFYRGLGTGMGTAEALRAAQRHVRDLTVRDLSRWCAEVRAAAAEAGECELVARLDLDLAHAAYLGRDFESALSRYRTLAAAGPNSEAEAGVLYSRRALRHPLPPDDTRRPYADPHYWAPFILIGDWL